MAETSGRHGLARELAHAAHKADSLAHATVQSADTLAQATVQATVQSADALAQRAGCLRHQASNAASHLRGAKATSLLKADGLAHETLQRAGVEPRKKGACASSLPKSQSPAASSARARAPLPAAAAVCGMGLGPHRCPPRSPCAHARRPVARGLLALRFLECLLRRHGLRNSQGAVTTPHEPEAAALRLRPTLLARTSRCARPRAHPLRLWPSLPRESHRLPGTAAAQLSCAPRHSTAHSTALPCRERALRAISADMPRGGRGPRLVPPPPPPHRAELHLPPSR